jgi:hypothetical protein
MGWRRAKKIINVEYGELCIKIASGLSKYQQNPG